MMAGERNKIVGVGAAALVAAAVLYFLFAFVHASDRLITPVTDVSIGGTVVHVAIAKTPQERERGLSGITKLGKDEGMLFIFERDDQYSFWMKDMRLSIDMLWLSAEKEVVFIEKDVSPDTFPQAFTPDTPARYVLEVPAGFADFHHIEKGTKAVF